MVNVERILAIWPINNPRHRLIENNVKNKGKKSALQSDEGLRKTIDEIYEKMLLERNINLTKLEQNLAILKSGREGILKSMKKK